jgi:hypothetical protein
MPCLVLSCPCFGLFGLAYVAEIVKILEKTIQEKDEQIRALEVLFLAQLF